MNKILRLLLFTLLPVAAFGNATTGGPSYAVGAIAPTPMDSGTWLQMNGQVQLQATYPALFSVIGHKPQFVWTTTPILGAVTFNQVAFGNSTYVAVGTSGGVYTSTNLTTWTSRTSGVATTLQSVCWSTVNSLFVAVGNSNVILTSPDGITWTPRTSGVTSTLASVIEANGELVAVGSAGWVTHSTNATSWTAAVPAGASTTSLAWLVYYNSTFFACPLGDDSHGIVFSTDGATFTFTAKPTTNDCAFAGFSNSHFYLTDLSTGAMWSSPTGATWTAGITRVNFVPSQFSNMGPLVCSSGSIAFFATNPIWTTTTADNFTTTQAPQINNFYGGGVVVGNPLGVAGQFGIVSLVSGSGGPAGFEYTVDGHTFYPDPFASVANPAVSTPDIYSFANSTYFVMSATAGLMIYAPSPYNPTTQFQIPNNAPTGTPLYIKAL